MIEVKVDSKDLFSILDNIINNLEHKVDDAKQECAEIIIKGAQSRTKGELSKSFYTYKDGDFQIIDNSKEYAQFVEFGRGPVTAVNAKALRFVINGEVIFRKSVGPAKAQHFMRDSLKDLTKSEYGTKQVFREGNRDIDEAFVTVKFKTNDPISNIFHKHINTIHGITKE